MNETPEQAIDSVMAAPPNPPPAPVLVTLSPAPPAKRSRSSSRALVESILALVLGMTLFRSFAAEAYIVPTGSMAPTLLGAHRDISCSHCRFTFALGVDEDGRAGRPICPNCAADLSQGAATERSGDRLLVHKFLYDIRPPRRWEVVVFQNDNEPGQAYVKRLVGLPGESVEIREGDVLVNGARVPRSLGELRAMRILIHDSAYRPQNGNWFPRWSMRTERGEADAWLKQQDVFVHQAANNQPDKGIPAADYLDYHHVDPDRGDFGPVRDFVSYNGAHMGSDRPVTDLMVELDLSLAQDSAVAIRLRSRGDRIRITIPARESEAPYLQLNGSAVELTGIAEGIRQRAFGTGCKVRLEASYFDQQLMVAINGRLLFEPVDLQGLAAQTLRWHGTMPDSPVSIGVIGGDASVHRLRIYRDVHYTDGLAYSPTRPFGVGEPYRLNAGEYFVLGDNSPVSNDSRFWPKSPVVRHESLLGKPFLVHLPSRGVPLKVFGKETYWVPDLREIRYIR
jgi:signal peptidase I